MNEADTCRKYVVPALQSAGWDDAPHRINEQRIATYLYNLQRDLQHKLNILKKL